MRPALPTASSNVNPSDSHPPTIDRGPPTEMISDSSSASVPSSSTRLLTSSLPLTASRTMGGIRGELINREHINIRGCSGTLHRTTTLASHNDSTLLHLLLFINHDEWRGFFSTITWWIYNVILQLSRLFNLTDLSASNDVSRIF